MNEDVNYKLADDALEMIVGGQGNGDPNGGKGAPGKRIKHVCPNEKKINPEGHKKPYYFIQYSGGRAYCEVCHTEIDV